MMKFSDLNVDCQMCGHPWCERCSRAELDAWDSGAAEADCVRLIIFSWVLGMMLWGVVQHVS